MSSLLHPQHEYPLGQQHQHASSSQAQAVEPDAEQSDRGSNQAQLAALDGAMGHDPALPFIEASLAEGVGGGGELRLGAGQAWSESTLEGHHSGGEAFASLTKQQLDTHSEISAGRGAESAKGQAKVWSDGLLNLHIEPIVGESPARYALVLRVGSVVGGGLEGSSAGERGQAKGEASLGVELSANMQGEYRRVLSEREALDYGAQLDAARQGTLGGFVEHDVLAQWVALVQQGGELGGVVAGLGRAESASSMRAGDSLRLTLGGEAVGSAAGSVGGAGAKLSASGSASASVERELVVQKGEGTRVELTVRFGSAMGVQGQVEGGYGVGSVGLKGGQSQGESSARVFALDAADADYSAAFGRIAGAMTLGQLDAVARDPLVEGLLSRSVESEARESGWGVEASLAGVGMELGSKGSLETATTLEDGKVGFEGTARREETVGGSFMGVGVGRKNLDIGEMRVGENGLSGGLGSQQDTGFTGVATDWLNWAREGLFGDWSNDLDPELLLEKALSDTKAKLREIRVSTEDVLQLCERARDRHLWRLCVVSGENVERWEGLRGGLLRPKIDQALAAEDASGARLVALSEHILQFVSESPSGLRELERALRHWGEDQQTGLDESADSDLGQLVELDSLDGVLRRRWLDMERSVVSLSDLTATAGVDDPEALGDVWRLREELKDVRSIVERLAGISPRGRAEMEASLSSWTEHLDHAELQLTREVGARDSLVSMDVGGAGEGRHSVEVQIQAILDELDWIRERGWVPGLAPEVELRVREFVDILDYWWQLESAAGDHGGASGFDHTQCLGLLSSLAFGDTHQGRYRMWSARLD